jgi:hypothetical protein
MASHQQTLLCLNPVAWVGQVNTCAPLHIDATIWSHPVLFIHRHCVGSSLAVRSWGWRLLKIWLLGCVQTWPSRPPLRSKAPHSPLVWGCRAEHEQPQPKPKHLMIFGTHSMHLAHTHVANIIAPSTSQVQDLAIIFFGSSFSFTLTLTCLFLVSSFFLSGGCRKKSS